MAVAPQMREHMEVLVSTNSQYGDNFDRFEGGWIKLAKRVPALAMLIALSALGWAPPVLAQTQTPRSSQPGLPSPSDDLLKKLVDVYKDIHANPELSMQEQRTAGIAADWLRQNAYEVTD